MGELIAELYRVRLTGVGVGTYLKRWGLSFQRPDKRAVEQDPRAVRHWHQETWPEIRAKAKADGEILFADQAGIRPDQVTARTWGEKGKTPVMRRSGNRFSVNAVSAISTKGRTHFMVFTESFTAEVMCRFLDRLAGHFDHKVHLVVDGHSAHRSKKVRGWLAAHPDDVELRFLPPYSPEPNSDQYNPRDLRHKWTTVALTNGMSIHEVSRWLGRRSIKVTVDRYGRLAQGGRERCRRVVGAAVGPYGLTPGRATAARGADLVST